MSDYIRMYGPVSPQCMSKPSIQSLASMTVTWAPKKQNLGPLTGGQDNNRTFWDLCDPQMVDGTFPDPSSPLWIAELWTPPPQKAESH